MTKKTLLEEVYDERVDELKKMKVSDENYTKAIDGVTKLADRVIEEKKCKEERKSRWFKDAADVTIKAFGLVMTGVATVICLRYEETGSITTTAGRKWIDRILKN